MLSLVEAYVGFEGLRFGVHWTEVVSVWFIVWNVVLYVRVFVRESVVELELE